MNLPVGSRGWVLSLRGQQHRRWRAPGRSIAFFWGACCAGTDWIASVGAGGLVVLKVSGFVLTQNQHRTMRALGVYGPITLRDSAQRPKIHTYIVGFEMLQLRDGFVVL